jgi:hypothetical protein
MTKVFCEIVEDYVEINDKDCSKKVGSTLGTSSCPMKHSLNCPLNYL